MINMKIVLAILLLSGAVLADDILLVEYVINKDDTVEVTAIGVKSGKVSVAESAFDEYQIQIINSKSDVLVKLNIPVIFFIDDIGEVNFSSGSQRIGWNPSADKLQFLHNGDVIHEIDLNDVVCNSNGACEQYENAQNCPSDCATTTTAAQQQGSNNILMLITGVVILLVGVAALYFLLRRRGREDRILKRLK